ncbi:MAG: dihydropteroate synthase [Conexivisphaerales archaeon]
MRSSYLGSLRVGCSERVRIIGVINLSPESFYPGSVAKSAEDALNVARKQLEEGADIIDLGGMSSAPYKETEVSEEVEADRVVEAVRLIKRETDAVLSVDTYRSGVAEKALSAGADIVNDITGLQADRRMGKVIAEHSASAILMAKEDFAVVQPEARGAADIIASTLRKSINIALESGIPSDQIAVDPGIGFFRKQKVPWYEWDMKVLTSLPRLTLLGYPVVVGVSRKSFIGEIAGLKDPSQRLFGSLAAESIAIYQGADAVRTHDVASSLQAAKIAEEARRVSVNSTEGRCYRSSRDGGSEAYLLPPLQDISDAWEIIGFAGPESRAYSILSPKAIQRNILLLNIPNPLILIIKQEMLSLGGDVATPIDSILGERKHGNAVLIANVSQLKRLCSRLKRMEIGFLSKKGMLTPRRLAEMIETFAD